MTGGAKQKLLRDWQLWAAIIAAPVVWGVMAWVFPSGGHAGWVLSDPGRYMMLALIYPVLEEVVFRGMLQGCLRRRSWGLQRFGPLTVANVLTSLIFTALHFITHPPLAAALVFIPSLVFGYFRDRTSGDRTVEDGTVVDRISVDRTDGLGVPVILHCWYNAGYFLFFAVA